ncbi:hypothetical protein SAV31267_023130 [Streptomyces avermitilis]|uniref:Uncharacterized protein n=1 Tax=Streptomyces avermitilis TaxID=33903 RepID=A0A4D4MLA5_STRAX|nr:hypothetical protein SAV31267_023130 [Streptomyces avermitilis]
MLAEDRAADVPIRLGGARVDDQELLLGVRLRLLRDHVGELEADQHDHVRLGVHGRLHVLLLRGGVGGLVDLLRPVVRLGRGLHPVDGELEELVLADAVGSDQGEGLAAALRGAGGVVLRGGVAGGEAGHEERGGSGELEGTTGSAVHRRTFRGYGKARSGGARGGGERAGGRTSALTGAGQPRQRSPAHRP